MDAERAPAKTGISNAVIAKGQRIELPQGQYNRVCLLAASVEGDQKAVFEAGAHKAELNVEKWSGFAGQWDDRVWSSSDTELGNYGQMVRLRPGFIKRADLAWYSDHHRTPRKKHVPYSSSYQFAYGIDLPSGADWAGSAGFRGETLAFELPFEWLPMSRRTRTRSISGSRTSPSIPARPSRVSPWPATETFWSMP